MNQFLESQRFLYDRIKADIDIYPSDEELKEFQRVAKTYDRERYFTIYGCQKCVRELVNFVFVNYDKQSNNGQEVTTPPNQDLPPAGGITGSVESV